jgi:Mn-dependent DtxR family transcriptional regulator
MYREVTMIEFREVLRLWQEQVPKKRIAARLGQDPKTVRRYLSAAEAAGLGAAVETASLEETELSASADWPPRGRNRPLA